MQGNSDSDDGGLWWLGGGSDDEPPSQEYRTDRGATRPGNSSSILGNLSSSYPSSSLGRAPSSYPSLSQSQPLADFAPPPPPPPQARKSGKRPPPRRHRGRNALAIITILIALAVIGAFLWRAESGNGFYIGFGPAPTPTHIGFARKATVHFTRTTQTISAPATLVAATSGGQVTAKQV